MRAKTANQWKRSFEAYNKEFYSIKAKAKRLGVAFPQKKMTLNQFKTVYTELNRTESISARNVAKMQTESLNLQAVPKPKTTKQLSQLYSRYLKMYEKEKAVLQAKNLEIREAKYTKTQFKTIYKAMQNTQLETKTSGDIVEQLVKKQAYETTKLQAQKYIQYLKAQYRSRLEGKGFDIEVKQKDIPTLKEVMVSGWQGNKYLVEINNKLKEAYPHWTGMQRARWISWNLFGSPK